MKDVIWNGRARESIRRFRCSFLQSGRETLFNVLPAQELMRVVQEEAELWRDRLYAPLVVLRLFVEQVLHAEHACQDMVVRYASERVAQGEAQISLSSGPALILSPGGLQGVLSSYQPVIEKLSRAHRIIAYDRRFGGQCSSPLVVQTRHMACEDVIGLMDVLGIEQAYLGGGSFGAAISLRCAARYPERVRAIFPSNIAGGLICNSNLARRLFKSLDMALDQGIKAVIDAFIRDDRFSAFTPERAQYDPAHRKNLEATDPEDFA